MLRNTAKCYAATPHYKVLLGATNYYSVLQNFTPHYSVLQTITKYVTVLQNTIPYYKVLYYKALLCKTEYNDNAAAHLKIWNVHSSAQSNPQDAKHTETMVMQCDSNKRERSTP